MHQYTLKPVKIDIKRTQLKTKLSESIQSSFKIQFTFFGLPYGRWVNEYTKLGLVNLNFFRVGRVTGNRGTFFGLNISKNSWQKVVVVFCLPWAAGRIRDKMN